MKKIESLHQKAFFQWLAYWNPEASKLTWHTPNGGKRNVIEGSNFKQMGVKPGVPDVFMAVPHGDYHGLFIEFKAGKNSLTQMQNEMMLNLRQKGYMAEACYSVEDAIEIVRSYFGVS